MVRLAPTVTFNNGIKFPVIGLGTWQSKPGEVEAAVKNAIDIGYRHIDSAFIYGNEKEVGKAIRDKIAEGVIRREDIFLTSKLFSTFHRPEKVLSALQESLKNFGLDYVDLYLIHFPLAFKPGEEVVARDADGSCVPDDVDNVDTWKAMEKLVEKGLAKSIGISNFNKKQIQRILDKCKIPPATNQIEVHPYLTQKELIAFCKEKGIVVTAYSPFGSPTRPWAKPTDPLLLEDPKIKVIAGKYKKTSAQVVLRYLIQVGTVPIPKSVTKSRIQENFDIFDFELTPGDIATIDKFNCNGRSCPWPGTETMPGYPFLE